MLATGAHSRHIYIWLQNLYIYFRCYTSWSEIWTRMWKICIPTHQDECIQELKMVYNRIRCFGYKWESIQRKTKNVTPGKEIVKFIAFCHGSTFEGPDIIIVLRWTTCLSLYFTNFILYEFTNYISAESGVT